jgi:signal transduction histidine kinase
VTAEKTIPIRFSSQVFTDSAQGAFVVFSDLTRMKQLEEQLRRADRLAVLGTMAAGLAHEIRNPLAPIKTFVELIPERAADIGFLTRFTEIVGAQVARIDRLVSQLLSFSRVGLPHRGEVACHEVLHDIMALLAHDFNKRGVESVTSFNALSDRVFADRQQLEQVILNTLMNAAEAMPDGGQIVLTTGNRNNFFELDIQDSGPGVPVEVLSRIFDPFVTTKEGGTGLGLSIAYGIVADHGGTIDVVNGARGATVKVCLPTHHAREMAA